MHIPRPGRLSKWHFGKLTLGGMLVWSRDRFWHLFCSEVIKCNLENVMCCWMAVTSMGDLIERKTDFEQGCIQDVFALSTRALHVCFLINCRSNGTELETMSAKPIYCLWQSLWQLRHSNSKRDRQSANSYKLRLHQCHPVLAAVRAPNHRSMETKVK